MFSFGKRRKRKAHCPQCVREQRVKTLFQKQNSWEYENGLECVHEYYAFQCKGCETVFFCRASANSDDVQRFEGEDGDEFTDRFIRREYFPTEARAYYLLEVDPDLAQIAPRVSALLTETVRAANSGLNTLAAIGVRTTFDSATEYLGVDPGLPFGDKLETLRKASYISGKEKGFLEVLIDAGGAAAHRGWEPTDKDLNSMIETLAGFLGAMIMRPKTIETLSTAIPNRTSAANSQLTPSTSE